MHLALQHKRTRENERGGLHPQDSQVLGAGRELPLLLHQQLLYLVLQSAHGHAGNMVAGFTLTTELMPLTLQPDGTGAGLRGSLQ